VTDRLGPILEGIERGEFPPADFQITHVAAPSPRESAVVSTTGHVIVAADVTPDWLGEHLPTNDPGAAFNPPFLRALELQLDRRVNNIDLMLLAGPMAGPPEVTVRTIEDQTHSRVRRAQRYRTDLTVYSVDGAVMIIGRGVAGRWEVALEVAPECRGKGLGRSLATAARHLVPEDRPIWAQVAPGNAASLRAFLAAGFLPVGEEALLVSHHVSAGGPTP
jgi:ribosomal protein S18 acetylase RimI-like enzyme